MNMTIIFVDSTNLQISKIVNGWPGKWLILKGSNIKLKYFTLFYFSNPIMGILMRLVDCFVFLIKKMVIFADNGKKSPIYMRYTEIREST